MEDRNDEDIFAADLSSHDCVRKDGGDKCITCDYGKRGRCINYSVGNNLFQGMNVYEKADYGIFMMNYNVERNAEFAGGFSDVRTAGKDWQSIVGFHLLRKPQRFINLATFVAFSMVIILIVLLIILVILGVLFKIIRLLLGVEIEIPKVKKAVLFWMIIALIFIALTTFMIQWVYDRTIDRLENIMYIIK